MSLMRTLIRAFRASMRRPEQLSRSIVVPGCFGHGKRTPESGGAEVGRKGGMIRGTRAVRVEVGAAWLRPQPEQPATIATKSKTRIKWRTREVSQRRTSRVGEHGRVARLGRVFDVE